MILIRNKNSIQPQDFIVLVKDQQLYLEASQDWDLYRFSDVNESLIKDNTCLFVGEFEQSMCYVFEIDASVSDENLVSLRSQMHLLSEDKYHLASRSLQLITWYKQHRFCGQCGQQTTSSAEEVAVCCHHCKLTYYPRISPCMMCLIHRGDYVLLAHHRRYATQLYSTLAGFVEAGESLEQCLHREVFEEVGLKVKNLHYFSSQSWPYPHQLMVGYFAEYDSGDIVLEELEIEDAQWFHYDQLPTIPPITTLSGQLIDAFVKSREQSNNQ